MSTDLSRLIDIVSAKLSALPAIDSNRFETHAEHRGAAEAALDDLARTEGARWSDRGSELSFALGGFRASSTGGAASAMRNWLTAARKRLAATSAGDRS